MRVLILRPYYGFNICGDNSGDMGHLDFAGQISPDLGLVYGAAILREAGHEVAVMDCNGSRISTESMFARLAGAAFDLVLLKICAPSVQADLEVASRIKAMLGKTRLVVGGHAARVLEKWLHQHAPFVDEVATEPIEDYAYRLCHPGQSGPASLRSFPAPAYDLFPHQNYRERSGQNIAYLWSSRGCPMSCSYCPYTAFYGHRVDERPVTMLMDDLKGLYDMGFRLFQFRDPFFTANPRRTEDLCRKLLAGGMDIEWFCETRIDSISDELAALMGAAGCRTVFFGVESASEDLLKQYSRSPFTVECAQKAIGALHNAKVDTMGLYIIGFPDEEWESIYGTYRLAEGLNTTYAHFSVYIPYPGTTGPIRHEDITPAIFDLFSNQITTGAAPHISSGELQLAAEQLDFMYCANHQGLQEACRMHRIRKAQQKRAGIRLEKYKLAWNMPGWKAECCS